MSWAAAIAGSVALTGAAWSATSNYMSGKEATEASSEAAAQQIASEQQQLDYLQAIDALPQQMKAEALTKLGEAYGIAGPEQEQAFMDSVRGSELFSGLQSEGEGAVLRNASMTGGLRSGNVQDALATNSQEALQSAYNNRIDVLQGMAGLGTNESEIGGVMSGIGATTAQGTLAQGQIRQDNIQNMSNNLMTGLGGAGSAMAPVIAGSVNQPAATQPGTVVQPTQQPVQGVLI